MNYKNKYFNIFKLFSIMFQNKIIIILESLNLYTFKREITIYNCHLVRRAKNHKVEEINIFSINLI